MKVGNGLQNRRKNGKNSYSGRLLLDFHNGGQMKKRQKDILYSLHTTIICPYCLKPIDPGELTKDHKNAYARFHDNSPENIVFCCKKCNNEKGMLTAEEYKLYSILDKVRKGNKDERNLEMLKELKPELLRVLAGQSKDSR